MLRCLQKPPLKQQTVWPSGRHRASELCSTPAGDFPEARKDTKPLAQVLSKDCNYLDKAAVVLLELKEGPGSDSHFQGRVVLPSPGLISRRKENICVSPQLEPWQQSCSEYYRLITLLSVAFVHRKSSCSRTGHEQRC